MPWDNRFLTKGEFEWPVRRVGGIDDGRYLYRMNSGTNTSIQIIDLSLITSGNYLGAGPWTSNPLSSISGLTSWGTSFIEYNCDLKILTRHRSGSGELNVIDCNPNSASFHTVINSVTIPTVSGTTYTCYVPHLKGYIHFVSSTNRFWRYPENRVFTASTVGDSNHPISVNPYNGDLIAQTKSSNFFTIYRVVGFNKGIPIFKNLQGNKSNATIFQFFDNTSEVILCADMQSASGNNIVTYKYPSYFNKFSTDFEQLASVTQNISVQANRYGSMLQKTKQLYVVNGLVTHQYDCNNPLAITSVTSHTRTAVGTETGAFNFFCSQQYPVLAIPANGTGNCMHFYDISAGLTYIGYVAFGNANGTSLYSYALNKFSQL